MKLKTAIEGLLITQVKRPCVFSWRGKLYPRHPSSTPQILKNNWTNSRMTTPQLPFNGDPMKSANTPVLIGMPGVCQGVKKSGGAMAGMAAISNYPVNDTIPMLKKVTRSLLIAHNQSFPIFGSNLKRVLILLTVSGYPSRL